MGDIYGKSVYDELVKNSELYKGLLEENRKLKEELEKFSEAYKKYRDYEKEELAESCYDMEEQNKSLKNELMEDIKTETELEERIRFLEQCLDNKEKVNKSLREELERYKKQYEHTMGEDL